MLHGLHIDTGIEMDALVAAGEIAQELIGRRLSGKYLQAALGERERKKTRRAQT
jgi:hydroxymethylglutaryl-CoA lyase